jgi:putative hydrolase of the HAD superfamily
METRRKGLEPMNPKKIRGVVWDWGDTLMRDIPGQKGPMATWPQVEAMPGAIEALRALAWIPVHCVATNTTDSTSSEVAEALGRVGLLDYLTHCFTSAELGSRKPDPRFFLRSAQRLGIPPDDLLAVGNDLRKDIIPAKEAGLSTVLVSSDPGQTLENAADLTVPTLSHLAEYCRQTAFPWAESEGS